MKFWGASRGSGPPPRPSCAGRKASIFPTPPAPAASSAAPRPATPTPGASSKPAPTASPPASRLTKVDPAIARLIDHTLLKPEATRSDIVKLCAEARQYGFASVCVNPYWVPLAAKELAGSPVKVCTVAGFPLGATSHRRQGRRGRRGRPQGRPRNRHGHQRRRAALRRERRRAGRHRSRGEGVPRRAAPSSR